MKYVSVTSPGTDMSKPIFNYFDDYLISLGEPITGENWKHSSVLWHVEKILKERPKTTELYIDSGGFQIIVGYVKSIEKINDFIETYHYTLFKFKDQIKNIFSLDVFSTDFMTESYQIEIDVDGEKQLQTIPIFPENYKVYTPDEVAAGLGVNDNFYEANKWSIQKSLWLIDQYPEIADKQLFVLQSSNTITFQVWKQLFTELELYKHYKRWSIGGLVGLKKSTNAKFSHAVPATLWLLTYQKKYDFVIDQVHWLGQSSKLSFLAMRLFEKMYNINMTSDSSQLVRFAPLEAKLPYIIKEEETFRLIMNKDDVIKYMFPKLSYHHDHILQIGEDGTINNSFKEEDILLQIKMNPNAIKYKCISELVIVDGKIINDGNSFFIKCSALEYFKTFEKLHNKTFIDFQSQNLFADLEFGNYIVDMIMDKGVNYFDDVEKLRELHPIMARGRVAQELFNNLGLFEKFKPIVESGDTDAADKIMEDIIDTYMEREKTKQLMFKK